MIYVVIPAYNRKAFTRGCLLCLRAQTYRDFEAIIVDDGSTDGTSDMIASEFPEMTVLHGDGNLWWTKAINMGVRYALEKATDEAQDLILTLNDDLTFGPDYLATLVNDFAKNQPCLMGSVGVDVHNPHYLEYAGTACNYKTAKTFRVAERFNNNYSQLQAAYKVIPTDDLPGRGTLIPVRTFREIGLYDEQNFPHYMADIEFSVRARRAGYQLYVSVEGVVHNFIDATRNKRRSLRQFFRGYSAFESPNYLRMRYAFAMKHTSLKQLYFLIDVSRMTLGFIRRR